MIGLNETRIIGNVVRDAELKMIPVEGTPTPRCTFRVAVNDVHANGDKITVYFDVTLWRNQATKLAPWILKGRQVYVSGSVRLNEYINANKVKRASLQLHKANVILLDQKPNMDTEDFLDFDYDDEMLCNS